jgi:hypothetical protein
MYRGFSMSKLAAAALLFIGSTGVAHAADSIQIPEPTDLLLFSMGVLGLIIGRQAARKKPPKD